MYTRNFYKKLPLMHEMIKKKKQQLGFCIFIIQHILIKKVKVFHLCQCDTVMGKLGSMTLRVLPHT